MTPEKIQEHEVLCTELMQKMPDGKWKTEVHRLNWKAHGLDCMIVRQPHSGHLCGYVGLPPGHPLYGKAYNDSDFPTLDVHGGITYSEKCHGFVCHIPEVGEPDELFWHGFDCMHSGDMSPRDLLMHEMALEGKMSSAFLKQEGYESYKDVEYVKAETENLAKQLAQVAA